MDSAELVSNVWGYAWYFLPFFAAILGGAYLWDVWVDHVRGAYVGSLKWVMLRIVPPPEVFRSPVAMEVFTTALFQTSGEGNWFDLYWKGKRRAWFSLEMVSMGGDVRFYIRSQESFARLIETQLYAQYPGVEIEREEDYTDEVFYESSKYDWFGADYKLEKPDPYPIRTYVDYGLLDEDKPELQVDPLAPTIEFLSSVPKGFQAWIQIVVKAHKKEAHKEGTLFGVEDSWQEAAKKEIQNVRERVKTKDKEGKPEVVKPSKRQEFVIEAIERSVAKYGFDTTIRTISVFPQGALDAEKGFMKAGLGGAFRQFNSLELNGFKADNTTSIDYPWQDWRGKKLAKKKKKILEAFRDRSFKDETFVLNTEELATIFHLPSSSVSAPTFGRVQSRRGDPPPNLPV
jgi:hypothetical protein